METSSSSNRYEFNQYRVVCLQLTQLHLIAPH